MIKPDFSLDDRYLAEKGTIFASGLQALVRLPIVQMRRDRAAGLNTACLISGYRGSPLGGYDQQLAHAGEHLAAHDILFRPAVNEDLAATQIWGSQQLQLSPGAKRDGVVGIWYGKGPGVDRSGDVWKHGNAAGSARHGGVLCIAGDDHGAKSSTVPHQSDHAFMSALMPMLYPAGVEEFVEFGLLGIAMSRYSGCWVGMKVISDTVETTAAVELGGEQRAWKLPEDFALPEGGLNLRWPDDRWAQDARLQNTKAYAALAFARANRIDRIVVDSDAARFGIIASGKSFADVRQALVELGIDDEAAAVIGLRLYKVGMPWPLEPQGVRAFSRGLEEILVVEERREIIENQIKQALFNWHSDERPRIVGKFDHRDQPVLPLDAVLSVDAIARTIADRLLKFELPPALAARIADRLRHFTGLAERRARHHPPVVRPPYFCAGCPHNRSTKLPEGSRALAGIGCHFMALWMDRSTATFTHMGGEGVNWLGTAPFTDEPHVFANLGDGTYYHSGILAIRQAVASRANLTYKILYNDAVAMTGGQHVDGPLSVEAVSRQLAAEGVAAIAVVAEAPERIDQAALSPGTSLHPRAEMDKVMRRMRDTPGTTAIIYDQTCAAEKRRRRKRHQMPDPDLRLFINPEVCEGCGDCSVQSNCIAVEPLDTEMGRKRQINQSACNKDYSCLEGFCPSFVSVTGAQIAKSAATQALDPATLPEPRLVDDLTQPYNILVTGVGGTGVLTVGAILGMAAHLEDKAVMILDMSGLAQKGGAVLSHVRIGARPRDVACARISSGGADLLFAADDVVAVGAEAADLCLPERTAALVNTHRAPIADFVRHRDVDFHDREVIDEIAAITRPGGDYRNFEHLALEVVGDAIATNILMLGFACQRGLLPVGWRAIERAIELNGVAVKANRNAFRQGRKAALTPVTEPETAVEPSLTALIDQRARHLDRYQGPALSQRYRRLIERLRAAHDDEALLRAAAISYAKLLAYKDEYEVARLYAAPEFAQRMQAQFSGDYRLQFHLAPPLFSRIDPHSGRPRKVAFGGWMLPVFRLLHRLKGLRGTALDPFGYGKERQAERALIGVYEAMVETAIRHRGPAGRLRDYLALPEAIRGFGPVKAKAIAEFDAARAKFEAELGIAEVATLP